MAPRRASDLGATAQAGTAISRQLRQFEARTAVPEESVFGPIPGCVPSHIYRERKRRVFFGDSVGNAYIFFASADLRERLAQLAG